MPSSQSASQRLDVLSSSVETMRSLRCVLSAICWMISRSKTSSPSSVASVRHDLAAAARRAGARSSSTGLRSDGFARSSADSCERRACCSTRASERACHGPSSSPPRRTPIAPHVNSLLGSRRRRPTSGTLAPVSPGRATRPGRPGRGTGGARSPALGHVRPARLERRRDPAADGAGRAARRARDDAVEPAVQRRARRIPARAARSPCCRTTPPTASTRSSAPCCSCCSWPCWRDALGGPRRAGPAPRSPRGARPTWRS